MTQIIIILGLVAAVLFAVAMVFRAYNRPKWEAEKTSRAKAWFEFRKERLIILKDRFKNKIGK